jgi:glycosyltransferase involved in cell wall biosynthesis
MKIALLCPAYPPSFNEGGVSHYTQKLAQTICNMGDDVFVITNEEYLGNGTDGKIQVIKIHDSWNGHTVKKIIKILSSLSIDVVNLQYTPSMYLTSFKCRWKIFSEKFVSIISLHTLWGGSKINYFAALRLLKSANGIVATNSEVFYLIRKYLPFFLKKTHFIPIGANIEPLTIKDKKSSGSLANKYGLNLNNPILAFFGMIYSGKGLKRLLETASYLRRKHNLDFQLVIIGGGISDDSNYRHEATKLSSELDIADLIVWTGRVLESEVSALLSLSTMVLLPFNTGVSDRRGSLLAALAHGKPIITSRPSIPIPFFQNGVNMVWPCEYTSEAFAELVLKVIHNNGFRQKIEKGALDLAYQFKWPAIAKKTLECFRKELAKA